MKTTLTDYYTKRQLTILYKNVHLPAFGEDGFEYMIFSNLMHNGEPRTDCDIIDMEKKMAIKRWCNKNNEPIQFNLDKKSFAKATSIEEYINMINHK